MHTTTRPRPRTALLTGVFSAAAASGLSAIVLIVQILFGHGSPAGNILRIGLAAVALLIACCLIAFGCLYRMSFDHELR